MGAAGELVLIRVVEVLDELEVAATLATIARLEKRPIGELAARCGAAGPASFDEHIAQLGAAGGPPTAWQDRPRIVLGAGETVAGAVDMLGFLRRSALSVDVFTIQAWSAASGPVLDVQRLAEINPAVGVWKLDELVANGRLAAGDELVWRPGGASQALQLDVGADGRLSGPDGSRYASPSLAARALSGQAVAAGWQVWTVPKRGGLTLAELAAGVEPARSEMPDVGAEPLAEAVIAESPDAGDTVDVRDESAIPTQLAMMPATPSPAAAPPWAKFGGTAISPVAPAPPLPPPDRDPSRWG